MPARPQMLADALRSPMSFDRIRQLRDAMPSQAAQQQLAPMEHEAFARSWTQSDPWVAVPSLLAAIPAYQGAKALGLVGSRTGASEPLAQMAAGYRGMWQGLSNDLGGK